MIVNKAFIFAGKAIFTVNNATGTHYTFRLNVKPDQYDKTKKVCFASLLTGSNNLSDYSYIGMVNVNDCSLRMTKGSKIAKDSKPANVLRWILNIINQEAYDKLPEGYAVNHDGRCCRCAKVLTHPDSIKSGIGPECIKKMSGYVPTPKKAKKPTKRTEDRHGRDLTQFDYLTLEVQHEYGTFGVFGHGEYERSSVCYGQQRRVFLDSFDTHEEAQTEYPEAETSCCTRVNDPMSLMPTAAPDWFDPANAGETWHEDDC